MRNATVFYKCEENERLGYFDGVGFIVASSDKPPFRIGLDGVRFPVEYSDIIECWHWIDGPVKIRAPEAFFLSQEVE